MLSAITSRQESIDSFETLKLELDSGTLLPKLITIDDVDNPLLRKLFESDEAETNIFKHMKSECNRLYSYQNKWPLRCISPESLADAGFFYLQQEDKVQCAFCEIIIFNWTEGDKPLREHMKRSPKCRFLMGHDVGNIPLSSEKCRKHSVDPTMDNGHLSNSVNVTYKPKHPRMADVKRRLLTYSGWPLNQPQPQQLAECGLYYSGVCDVVTCFFCGGTLGNWEPDDDPWNEHAKFFPECSFLELAKNKRTHSNKIVEPCEEPLTGKKHPVNGLSSANAISEIIEQALDIFPEDLVLKAVKSKSGKPFSLQEICDDILRIKQSSNSQPTPSVSLGLEAPSSSASNTDLLLCKVCMDRERSIVFQPCGHFVSCWNCANLVADCPVCRRPIIHKIKTYIS